MGHQLLDLGLYPEEGGEMNHLGNQFYTMPEVASMTMTRKQLKETLLDTDGYTMACGHLWDIKSKHLGAGVYRVSLSQRVYGKAER